MRIGIAGAGAIGGWIAAKLAQAGHEVSAVARGATLAAIERDGLILREAAGEIVTRPRVSNDPATLGVQDMLVIAVKAQSLAALAAAIRPMVGPDTAIVPMLNGVPWWFLGSDTRLESVDPDGVIAEALPYSQVIGCVVHASAASPAPGVAALKFADKLILGEPGGGGSARLDRALATFREAGVNAVASARVQQDIWYKLWGNMTMNPVSALTLATADRILDDDLVRGFALNIMAEAKAVGGRIGYPIAQSGEDRNGVTRALGAFKTSMLQDVEGGRSIELDALLAAPREIARREGMATPWMDALFGLARLMGRSRGLY